MTPTRIVYVAGWMRSGTTLLGQVYGSLPGTVSLGEISGAFRSFALGKQCTCGRTVPECNVWRPAIERATDATGLPARDLASLTRNVMRTRNAARLVALARMRRQDWPDMYALLAEAYESAIRTVETITGVHVIIDTSKLPPLALFYRAIGLPVHMRHIVRRPEAVAHSESRTQGQINAVGNDVPPGASVLASSLRWSSFNMALLATGPLLTSYELIAYEDVVRDSQRIAKDLGTSLGLRTVEGRSGLSHMAEGNPSRYRHAIFERDDRWLEEMAARDRLIARLVTATPRLAFMCVRKNLP